MLMCTFLIQNFGNAKCTEIDKLFEILVSFQCLLIFVSLY